MKFTTLNIPPEGSWKRDCELYAFTFHPLSLEFTKDSDSSRWKIIFDGFIAFKVTSEEFAIHLQNLPSTGSFYLVEDSPWLKDLKRLNSDILTECKHFVFFFYDEIVEVISNNISYVKLESEN